MSSQPLMAAPRVTTTLTRAAPGAAATVVPGSSLPDAISGDDEVRPGPGLDADPHAVPEEGQEPAGDRRPDVRGHAHHRGAAVGAAGGRVRATAARTRQTASRSP